MVEVTDANAREAAAAAERLLHDPFLNEALDEMIQIATEQAITGETRERRRDGRFTALAIVRLRGNLTAVFQTWQGAAETLRHAKANE